MIKTISTAFLAFAVITFAGMSSEVTAQDCSSCGSVSSQDCSSCGSVSSFSYPATRSGCGHGGCLGHGGHGGHVKELKNQLNHQSAINAKAAARNDAWPLPFACHDKRRYHEVWGPMLAAGSETQGILDHNFFTSNHELNRVGIDRLAEIALNSPVNERSVYVSRSANASIDQARMNAVRNTIATYYSHRGAVDVRLSEKVARTTAASKVKVFNDSYIDSQPAPTIFDVEGVNDAVQTQ